MTMTGEGPWQPRQTAKFKSISEIKDADTVNFSLFMVDEDGKELPIVKITYRRKKCRPRDGVSHSPVFKGDWWSWPPPPPLCHRNPIPRSHHEREERSLRTPFRPG